MTFIMISAQNEEVSAIVTKSPIQDYSPCRFLSASFGDTRLATRRRGVIFVCDCRSILKLIARIAFFTVESIMNLTDRNVIGSFYKRGTNHPYGLLIQHANRSKRGTKCREVNYLNILDLFFPPL